MTQCGLDRTKPSARASLPRSFPQGPLFTPGHLGRRALAIHHKAGGRAGIAIGSLQQHLSLARLAGSEQHQHHRPIANPWLSSAGLPQASIDAVQRGAGASNNRRPASGSWTSGRREGSRHRGRQAASSKVRCVRQSARCRVKAARIFRRADAHSPPLLMLLVIITKQKPRPCFWLFV